MKSARCLSSLRHGATKLSSRVISLHAALQSHPHFNQSPLLKYQLNNQCITSIHTTATRDMYIQTQTTPNPQSLKFLPGKPVLPDDYPQSAVDFSNYKSAQSQSPLASALFSVDGVVGVMLGKDFISINIDESTDWLTAKPHVYGIIMDHYTSNKPIINTDNQSQSDTTITDEDDEVISLIKELIETRIRPAVQEDGGDIIYKGMDRDLGVVRVQMVGSCKGCSSSAVTLKNGIENMLMHYVPEVTQVEEYIDPEQEQLNRVSQEQLRKLEEGRRP